MIKRHPEQTIAFRVYANGTDLLGIANVEMPEFASMTDTISGTGVAGEYEAPTIGSFSSMSVKFQWTSQTEKFYSLMNPIISLQLECRASIQTADPLTGAKFNQAHQLTVWGSVKKSSLGSLEVAKKQGNETEIEAMRIHYEIGNKSVVLLDKLNQICMINGVDVLFGVRQDLGLPF